MKVKTTDAMGHDEITEIDANEISGKDLLEKLNISTFEATISKNGEIVSEKEILTNKDKITILKMIHGG